jgi:hypothetical protein
VELRRKQQVCAHFCDGFSCEEEIASQARTVFNEYTAEASRDEQHQDSSWMVSRIMGLVERMPAILMGSGKQVELRLELQKVIGYMECCNGRGLGSALINSVAFQEALIRKTCKAFCHWHYLAASSLTVVSVSVCHPQR